MSISAPRELDQHRARSEIYVQVIWWILFAFEMQKCCQLSKMCHCSNMKLIVQCPFSLLFNFNNCSFPFIIEFAWIGNMRLWYKVDVSFCATKHHSGSNERPEWCFVSWKNAWCHGGSKRSKTWTLNRESAQTYVLYVCWEKQGGVECWRMQKRLQSCHIELF